MTPHSVPGLSLTPAVAAQLGAILATTPTRRVV
jgi:hypothetical protein